jgi:glycosyltransferase involved in cell wall biosynthesis
MNEITTVNQFKKEKRREKTPFFSFCIPEYNRFDFLSIALESLKTQTFQDFEVCISDDCSPEKKHQEIVSYLEKNDIAFCFERQDKNLRYDGNLRASISMAQGKYCFLLGNDDKLLDNDVLQKVHDFIVNQQYYGVLLLNYFEISSGKNIRRVSSSGVIGSGAPVAQATFRDYSFVSGVLLPSAECHALYTTEFDGTEMYQMYLGSRMVATGTSLAGMDLLAIGKDIQIPGQKVDSYANRPGSKPGWPKARYLPLGRMGWLVVRSVEVAVPANRRDACIRSVFRQILGFTYGYWIINYRKVQSWKYSLEICMGMNPSYQLRGLNPGWFTWTYLWMLYLFITTAGLLCPIFLFDSLEPTLYRIAKSRKR